MSDRTIKVYVEMQIRTIAMDFWASLEHKIYYKYNRHVPEYLTRQLKEAATTVAELDRKMEHINKEINILKENDSSNDAGNLMVNPRELMIQLMKSMDILHSHDNFAGNQNRLTPHNTKSAILLPNCPFVLGT